MKNKPGLPLKRICLVLLLPVLITLSSAHSAVAALTAPDLIIVFNRNMPESREVAAYYAGKRRVPVDNLVGVDVPTSEDLSRQDYDEKLVPPVKAMVDRLQAKGRTPAILLVYGIPPRVGSTPLTKSDMELQFQAITKVKEYQAQAVPLVHQLERLTGALTSPIRLTYPTPKFLDKSRESLVRGKEYLDQQPATPATEAARAEVSSLLIKLGGTSPEALALMAGLPRRSRPGAGAPVRKTSGITACQPGRQGRAGVSRYLAGHRPGDRGGHRRCQWPPGRAAILV